MTTITISAGAMFALGVATGIIAGVVGLCIIAFFASKKKK